MITARVPVLLVDDVPADLLALEAIFAHDTYELVSVHSGAEAVRWVQERDFAVALVAVQMPDLDGFETALRMKEAAAGRQPVPVIFVTGTDSAPARTREAYALGAVDFVQKPLQSEAIRAKVELFAELYRARGMLVEQRETASRALRALSDLALALSATRTPDDVAAAVVEHAMRVAHADTCSLHLLDSAGTALELVGHRGVATEVVDQIRVIAEASAPETFVALRGLSVTWAETTADCARLHPTLADTTTAGKRTRAFWRLPLVAEGRAIGLLGMGFHDERSFSLDERKLVETIGTQCAQALLRAVSREREERAHAWLSTTLRSIGDGVIATDTSGRVMFMNEVAEKLTAWTEADARGRPLEQVFAVFAQETRNPSESPVLQVLREGPTVRLANHTVLRTKMGVDIPIDDSAAPVRDAQGLLLGVVLVFRDATAEKLDRSRQRFLARAGATLASSLDYRSTLAAVAQFAVPHLADWCLVDLVDAAGGVQQVAAAHVDPAEVNWVRALGRRSPPDTSAAPWVTHVVRTGQSELHSEVTPQMLEAAARDEEHMRLLRDLQLESAMVVPLRGRERTLGVMTFVFAGSKRRYTQSDLDFAEEFARRAAMAVENSLALKKAEDARLVQGRAAEQDLFAAEFRFHQLVDAVTEYAIFMLDESGHVETWNSGAQRAKGYTAREIIGTHFSVFYTPEDRAAGRPQRILEAVRREGRFADEGWRVRKDGSRFWAHVSIAALRDERGEVVGFAKVTRDLTEKRAADENERKLLREQAARAASDQERRRLLSLLNHVPAAITFLRWPSLVVEFANQFALHAMGDRDVLGKSLREALPEIAYHPFIEHLRDVCETGEPYVQHEAAAWPAIGPERVETYWNSLYQSLHDSSGVIDGVMSFDLEVTENVRARGELERVNRAKDEFLATMSHELRTPLNAISGWATILRKKPLHDPQLERGLEVIERNAKAQTRLINDLLDVSRIVSGKLQLAITKTEVLPLVFAAADVVRPAADSKGVELEVEVDPTVGTAMVDPDRLQQIVWNLLSNAVRFTPRGGSVVLTGERSSSGVVIRVKDSGVGIAPEHLGHIFERFLQIDSRTTRKHGGLGLGLSIVRHLAEAHGGSVEAESEGLGHGAVFTVRLPVPAVNTVPPSPEWERPSGDLDAVESAVLWRGGSEDNTLEHVRALVVDDDRDSRHLIQTVLETAGALVTTASGAQEALEVLDAGVRIDVLISDIGMPEVDGFSLLRLLRGRPSERGGDVPAIALSAFARDVDTAASRRAGYQEHLAKPVDANELLRAVKRWARPRLAELQSS